MPPKGATRARGGAGGGATTLYDGTEVEAGFRLRGGSKLEFVSEMFDRITPTYDLLNLLISLGQTTIWRILALGFLPTSVLPRGARVLDVGCGTGWVSWFVRRWYRARGGAGMELVGLDCSERMLEAARKFDPGSEFVHGDVCAMEFEGESFDLVTTVYTLRNFPELEGAFREMVRVTKPGGTVVILDAFTPELALMRWLLRLWLNGIMPLIASLFADKRAYKYLSASIQGAAPSDEVVRLLEGLGCEDVQVASYTFGACKRIMATVPR